MRFLRVSICVLIAFSVLSFGGVEEWAQAGLELGAAALLVYWAIRFCTCGKPTRFLSRHFFCRSLRSWLSWWPS